MKRLVLVLAGVVLLVAACGDSGSGDTSGTTQASTAASSDEIVKTVEVADVALDIPVDWAITQPTLNPGLVSPESALIVGNATFIARLGTRSFGGGSCDVAPTGPLFELGKGEVMILIQVTDRNPGVALSQSARDALSGSEATQGSDVADCFRSADRVDRIEWVEGEAAGRAIAALVVMGPDTTQRNRDEVIGVLDSIRPR